VSISSRSTARENEVSSREMPQSHLLMNSLAFELPTCYNLDCVSLSKAHRNPILPDFDTVMNTPAHSSLDK